MSKKVIVIWGIFLFVLILICYLIKHIEHDVIEEMQGRNDIEITSIYLRKPFWWEKERLSKSISFNFGNKIIELRVAMDIEEQLIEAWREEKRALLKEPIPNAGTGELTLNPSKSLLPEGALLENSGTGELHFNTTQKPSTQNKTIEVRQNDGTIIKLRNAGSNWR